MNLFTLSEKHGCNQYRSNAYIHMTANDNCPAIFRGIGEGHWNFRTSHCMTQITPHVRDGAGDGNPDIIFILLIDRCRKFRNVII